MNIISIHQPMYLPYSGFFNKLKNVDIFVFGDDALYSKGYYYNRNIIKTSSGSSMLTVPLIKPFNQKLNEVQIDNSKDWGKKHLQSLYAFYKKSDYFLNYMPFFEKLYSSRWENLHDLNMKTIYFIMEQLNIEADIYFTSSLLKDYQFINNTQKIIDICNELDADTYLSGVSGKNYIDPILFEKNNIELKYQNYISREYKQLWGTFIPNLSIIDLLFNLGDKAIEVI